MMRTFIIMISAAVLVTGCRSKKHFGDQSPYGDGIGGLKWGSPASKIDSLAASDSLWKKISMVENSFDGGTIVVAAHDKREYYLEFDTKDRLQMISYIADTTDADTVEKRLTLFYGEPKRKYDASYMELNWKAETDSVNLEIQMLITRKQYALKVLNKKISNQQ